MRFVTGSSMKLMKSLIVLAAVTASGLTMAQSADRAGSWETRLGATFVNSTTWDFDGGTTANLDSSTGFLIGVAYHYTDNLEFGADFEFDEEGYDARIASGTVPGLVFPASGRIDKATMA